MESVTTVLTIILWSIQSNWTNGLIINFDTIDSNLIPVEEKKVEEKFLQAIYIRKRKKNKKVINTVFHITKLTTECFIFFSFISLTFWKFWLVKYHYYKRMTLHYSKITSAVAKHPRPDKTFVYGTAGFRME